MQPNSTYLDAKRGSVYSAILLYGDCSPEAIATYKTWNQVGVTNTVPGVTNPCYLKQAPSTVQQIPDDNKEVSVFPMPVSDMLFIRHTPIFSAANVSLTNMLGQVVYSSILSQGPVARLPVTALPAGTYRMVISKGNHHAEQKIQILH